MRLCLISLRKKWISRSEFHELVTQNVPECQDASSERVGREMRDRGFVIGETIHVKPIFNVQGPNARNTNQPKKKRRLNRERKPVWKHL